MIRKAYTPVSKNMPRMYYWMSFKRRFRGMWRDILGMITNQIQK